MKKLLALFGLVAGLAATSYSVPAVAAADRGSKYTGPTTQSAASDVIIIIIDENEYYWIEYYSNATGNTSSAAPALTDAAFDR